jgi:hypothetical protein
MSEQPSFTPEERAQVLENARVVIAGLAERAYTLFDGLLRRGNEALADFDPLGEQHKGDLAPGFAGLRPGYSRFWRGDFVFYAAVMEQQRSQGRSQQNGPGASDLRELMDRYILTPGSGLIFAGARTPETNGILDFYLYQRHINAINRQSLYTLEQVGRTLQNARQDYSAAEEEMAFNRRAKEAQEDIPMASRIFAVMRTIRAWVPDQLRRLNCPMSDNLVGRVLRAALAETADE